MVTSEYCILGGVDATPVKDCFVFLYFCAGVCAVAGSAAAEERIAWRSDFDAATSEARKLGKLAVAHFRLESRPLAKEMESDTFSHPEVIRFSNEKFVNVRVDIRARPDLFERTMGGRGGLGTCILDATGDVISILPGYADSEAYLGFLTRATREYPKLQSARSALAGSPNSLSHLKRMAELYEGLNNPQRAGECLERILSLGPRNGPNPNDFPRYAAFAHERLARARALRGKNREATSHLLEYRKLDRDNAYGGLDRALLTEALVAWIERRFKDSLRILQETLRRFPLSEERDKQLLALGTILHESGDDRAAMETLEKLLRDHPSSTSLRLAREQIDHIRNPPPEHIH